MDHPQQDAYLSAPGGLLSKSPSRPSNTPPRIRTASPRRHPASRGSPTSPTCPALPRFPLTALRHGCRLTAHAYQPLRERHPAEGRFTQLGKVRAHEEVPTGKQRCTRGDRRLTRLAGIIGKEDLRPTRARITSQQGFLPGFAEKHIPGLRNSHPSPLRSVLNPRATERGPSSQTERQRGEPGTGDLSPARPQMTWVLLRLALRRVRSRREPLVGKEGGSPT